MADKFEKMARDDARDDPGSTPHSNPEKQAVIERVTKLMADLPDPGCVLAAREIEEMCYRDECDVAIARMKELESAIDGLLALPAVPMTDESIKLATQARDVARRALKPK